MNFIQCPICNINLPQTMMIPIVVNNKGRRMKVLICERCKNRKEEEAKRRQDANN